MPDDLHPWTVLRSEIVIDTPHLRLRKDRIQTPRGDIVDNYHVRETRGFVVVFALTPHNEVILVRQYKHGIGAIVLELPAGAVDGDESPLEAASREFTEETGYTPNVLEPAGTFISDPTNSNGKFSLFFGRDAVPSGPQEFDATEDIAVELVPLERLLELVRNGAIDVAAHVASIYVMLDRLGIIG